MPIGRTINKTYMHNIVCITYVTQSWAQSCHSQCCLMSMQSGLTDDRADFGKWTSPSAEPRAPHVFTLPPRKNWTDFDRAGEFTTIECSSQAMFLVQQFRVSALSAQLCARHPSWNVCKLARQRGRNVTLAAESDAYRKKTFKQPEQFKTS